MKRRLIGVIIILLGILLLGGVVYVIFFDGFSFYDFLGRWRKQPASVTNTVIPVENTVQVVKEPKKIVVTENPVEKTGEKEVVITKEPGDDYAGKYDLLRMAASFSERFGSYSNQSNFSNVTDLKIFMSQRMKNWADTFVAGEQKKGIDNSLYYGIVTKAVTQEIMDLDDYTGEASVLVRTIRREAASSTSNVSRSFDQDIIINFTKEMGAWKVDSANWQAK
ncbi:hypothetical protein A2303_02260 [Candidatus Falkowbacteria bacterium RIFOXYB2_FULL_47_14]|uniref:Uncharacterized protein n=1 Tax=Candidatus Falkowbacteria bacterium RIFOXYA2_FULL_47_19 TaxID=1797994 RepID=A0A1F5SEM5_9BACT|nr:MAG: hypothetical protein A2227_07435 [Candidatus Falkowbacteria bacterium RIFOXYA2_FULL_47_19]OGF35245.1 MAG: hypothetical protein A2468_01060 [Candidatus Falkowbacteria bacterium RIFOXYC2_FULL_46_15]OGF43887.1 MAG: hypothetical protein A2303_02260 [Candidatus Falkowbacteria bacterium RIFOXYB2_FULL_47_14]